MPVLIGPPTLYLICQCALEVSFDIFSSFLCFRVLRRVKVHVNGTKLLKKAKQIRKHGKIISCKTFLTIITVRE